MEISTRIKIVAVIGIIVGPFLAFHGHQEKERLAKLEKEGVTVDGTVEGGEWRKGRRSSNYKFDVTFTPQNGAPVTQTFPVTSKFFSAHANDTAVTDPAVKVRYIPASVQESAIIAGGTKDDTASFGVGIGVFAISLVTLVLMFLLKK
jgi:uncharacterized protein DUF3592